VWVEASQTYYVLDLLSWKELRLVDHEYELRAFWAASRLAESRASGSASTNPCRFIFLPQQPCTTSALHAAYTGEGLAYARDGLLFYHREGAYEAGATPLVLLWSDARCSERFFDYGTDKMQQTVEVNCIDIDR